MPNDIEVLVAVYDSSWNRDHNELASIKAEYPVTSERQLKALIKRLQNAESLLGLKIFLGYRLKSNGKMINAYSEVVKLFRGV